MTVWSGEGLNEESIIRRGLASLGVSRTAVKISVERKTSTLLSLLGLQPLRVSLATLTPARPPAPPPFSRKPSGRSRPAAPPRPPLEPRPPRPRREPPVRPTQETRPPRPRREEPPRPARATPPPRPRRDDRPRPGPVYRPSPEEETAALFDAHQAAEAAHRTGEPQRLPPMSPPLRRLVHQALAEDPHVETKSEGEGTTRKIVVWPKNISH